ncbi:MAG: hypothetical protein MJ135_03475 [Oscillospiraceae bacterium]|nr:hypothetical protein [Oscillospiraceae bacterium]
MKKYFTRLLSLCMAVCLLAGLGISAYADNSVTLTAGPPDSAGNFQLQITNSEDLSGWSYTIFRNTAMTTNGATQLGTYSDKNGKTAEIWTGFANADTNVPKYYWFVVVNYDTHSYTSNIITTDNPTYIKPDYAANVDAQNLTYTAGKEASQTAASTKSGFHLKLIPMASGLPEGLSAVLNGDTVVVSGTPKTAGSYTVRFSLLVEADAASTQELVEKIITITVNAAAVPELKVTKSPSGETVTEGENALFISAAENYSKLEWRVVTADGNNCWRNKNEIEGKFTGVKVSTYKNASGQECMTLTNIPLSMNGYFIQTKFWNQDESKTAFTAEKSCPITVNQAALPAPVITSQPVAAEVVLGSPIVLTVGARASEGSLNYQWYRNTANSTAGGKKIDGANNPQYAVPQEVGSAYYYCTVWATSGSRTSGSATSAVVAATYKSAAPEVTPSPEPVVTPEPTPVPTEDPGVIHLVTPTPIPGPTEAPAKKDHTVLFVVAGLLAVLMICGTVIFLFLQKNRKLEEEEEYEDEDEEYSGPQEDVFNEIEQEMKKK